jgi:predicted  nucleic acid-binding Zn-ribbon protein
MEDTMFKSPIGKLVKFFERSRDRWKAKCLDAKHENKLLSNQARAVMKSRESWKRKAKEAQLQVRKLERELEELKYAADADLAHSVR